ncbi:MAG TPA: hypothetical protein VEW04_00335 [Allosphingosinicella sp.]|nr:hypothetical protein [Allosphingosinicella sp.]
MSGGGTSRSEAAARAANLSLAFAGFVLIALAAAAGKGWTDRHFLPAFAMSRDFQIGLVDGLRVFMALSGLVVLLVVRPRILRAVAVGRGRRLAVSALSAGLAIAAAFVVTEGVLHTRTWRATQERWGTKEPLRQADSHLGWTFVPSHRGQAEIDGRAIDYATNRFGYRVRLPADPLDLDRPTILLAGESFLLGYGLQWHETIQARLERATGTQVANLSVNAYASDQMYLRLRAELPRFRRPVAVVIPFVPMLFDRNLDRDRPHLDSHLIWRPAEPPSLRLVELARRLVRYRGTRSVDEGVAMTRAALRASIALVQARGGRALVLVPEYWPEEPAERTVRRRVLDEAHIPYLLVRLDRGWRLRVDRHPNPRGAEAIALALAAALREGG